MSILAQPPTTPGCQGRTWLFESLNPTDHLQAKTYCDTCPVLDWCRKWTEKSIAATNKDGAIEGTWAGTLYGAPPGALRMLREEQMFTDDESRAAHAAHFRGERSSRVKTGERVYQRRMGRLKPSRHIA